MMQKLVVQNPPANNQTQKDVKNKKERMEIRGMGKTRYSYLYQKTNQIKKVRKKR